MSGSSRARSLELLRALGTLATAPLSSKEASFPPSSLSSSGGHSSTKEQQWHETRRANVLDALRVVRRALARQLRIHARDFRLFQSSLSTSNVLQQQQQQTYSKSENDNCVDDELPFSFPFHAQPAERDWGFTNLMSSSSDSHSSIGSAHSDIEIPTSGALSAAAARMQQRDIYDFGRIFAACCAALLRRMGDSDMSIRGVADECFDSIVGALCAALQVSDGGGTSSAGNSAGAGNSSGSGSGSNGSSNSNTGSGSDAVDYGCCAPSTLADLMLFECLRALRVRNSNSIDGAEVTSNSRCQRSALAKFGQLAARTQHESLPFVIVKSTARRYAEAIVHALVMLAPLKTNDDNWWESLASAFPPVITNFMCFWQANESDKLFKMFSAKSHLAHTTSPVVRRSAAFCIAELIVHSPASWSSGFFSTLADSVFADAPVVVSEAALCSRNCLSDVRFDTVDVNAAIGVLQCYVGAARKQQCKPPPSCERLPYVELCDLTRFALNFVQHTDGNVSALALELLYLLLDSFEWNPEASTNGNVVGFGFLTTKQLVEALLVVVFPLLGWKELTSTGFDVRTGALETVNRAGLQALALNCVQSLCKFASGESVVSRAMFACFAQGVSGQHALWNSTDPLVRGNTSLCVSAFLEHYLLAAHWSCLQAGQPVALLLSRLIEMTASEVDTSTALRLHVRSCARILCALSSPDARKISPVLCVEWTCSLIACVFRRVDCCECYFGVRVEVVDLIAKFGRNLCVFEACVEHMVHRSSGKLSSRYLTWDQLRSLSCGGSTNLRSRLRHFILKSIEDSELRVCEPATSALWALCIAHDTSAMGTSFRTSDKVEFSFDSLHATTDLLIKRFAELVSGNLEDALSLLSVRAICAALIFVFREHGEVQDASGFIIREAFQNTILRMVLDAFRSNSAVHTDPSTHATLLRLCACVHPDVFLQDSTGSRFSARHVSDAPSKYSHEALKHCLRLLSVIRAVDDEQPIPTSSGVTGSGDETLFQGSDFGRDPLMLDLFVRLKELRDMEQEKGANSVRPHSTLVDSPALGFSTFVYDILDSLARLVVGAGPKVAGLTYEVVGHLVRWLPHSSCIHVSAAVVACVFGHRELSVRTAESTSLQSFEPSALLFEHRIGSVGRLGHMSSRAQKQNDRSGGHRVHGDITRRTQTTVLTALEPVFSRAIRAFLNTTNSSAERLLLQFFAFVALTGLSDQCFRLDGASGTVLVPALNSMILKGRETGERVVPIPHSGAVPSSAVVSTSGQASVCARILPQIAMPVGKLSSLIELLCVLQLRKLKSAAGKEILTLFRYCLEPPASEPWPRHALVPLLSGAVKLLFRTPRSVTAEQLHELASARSTLLIEMTARACAEMIDHSSESCCLRCARELFMLVRQGLRCECGEASRFGDEHAELWKNHSRVVAEAAISLFSAQALRISDHCCQQSDCGPKHWLNGLDGFCSVIGSLHPSVFDTFSLSICIGVLQSSLSSLASSKNVVYSVTRAIAAAHVAARLIKIDINSESVNLALSTMVEFLDYICGLLFPTAYSQQPWMRLLADFLHLFEQMLDDSGNLSPSLSSERVSSITGKIGALACPEHVITWADCLAHLGLFTKRTLQELTTTPKGTQVDASSKAAGWRTSPILRIIMVRSYLCSVSPLDAPSDSFLTEDVFSSLLKCFDASPSRALLGRTTVERRAVLFKCVLPYLTKECSRNHRMFSELKRTFAVLLLMAGDVTNGTGTLLTIILAFDTLLSAFELFSTGSSATNELCTARGRTVLRHALSFVAIRTFEDLSSRILRALPAKLQMTQAETRAAGDLNSSITCFLSRGCLIFPPLTAAKMKTAVLPVLSRLAFDRPAPVIENGGASCFGRTPKWLMWRLASGASASQALEEVLTTNSWYSLLWAVRLSGRLSSVHSSSACSFLLNHAPTPVESDRGITVVEDWSHALGWIRCGHELLGCTVNELDQAALLRHALADTTLWALSFLRSGFVDRSFDDNEVALLFYSACELLKTARLNLSGFYDGPHEEDLLQLTHVLGIIAGNLTCTCLGEALESASEPTVWRPVLRALTTAAFVHLPAGCPYCGIGAANTYTRSLRFAFGSFSDCLMAHPHSQRILVAAFYSQPEYGSILHAMKTRTLASEAFLRAAAICAKLQRSPEGLKDVIALCTGVGKSESSVVSTHERLQVVSLEVMVSMACFSGLRPIANDIPDSCGVCSSSSGRRLVSVFDSLERSLLCNQNSNLHYSCSPPHDHFTMSTVSSLGVCSCNSRARQVDIDASAVCCRGLFSCAEERVPTTSSHTALSSLLCLMGVLACVSQRPQLQRAVLRSVLILYRHGLILNPGISTAALREPETSSASWLLSIFASRLESSEVVQSTTTLPFGEIFSMFGLNQHGSGTQSTSGDVPQVLSFPAENLFGDKTVLHAFAHDIILLGSCVSLSVALEHSFLIARSQDPTYVVGSATPEQMYFSTLVEPPSPLVTELASLVVRGLGISLDTALSNYVKTADRPSNEDFAPFIDVVESSNEQSNRSFFETPWACLDLGATALVECRHPFFRTRVLSTLLPRFYSRAFARLLRLSGASEPVASESACASVALTSALIRQDAFATAVTNLEQAEQGRGSDEKRKLDAFALAVARLLVKSHNTLGLSGSSALVAQVSLLLIRDLLLRIPPHVPLNHQGDFLTHEHMLARLNAARSAAEDPVGSSSSNRTVELRRPMPEFTVKLWDPRSVLLPELRATVSDELVKAAVARNRALQRFPSGCSMKSSFLVLFLVGAIYVGDFKHVRSSRHRRRGSILQSMENMEYAKLLLHRLPKRAFPCEAKFMVEAITLVLEDVFSFDNALSLVLGELMRQLTRPGVNLKDDVTLAVAVDVDRALLQRSASSAPEHLLTILVLLFSRALHTPSNRGRIASWVVMCIENFVQLKSLSGLWALSCLMLGAVVMDTDSDSLTFSVSSASSGIVETRLDARSLMSQAGRRALLHTLLFSDGGSDCGDGDDGDSWELPGEDTIFSHIVVEFLAWIQDSDLRQSTLDALPSMSNAAFALVHQQWADREFEHVSS